MRYRMGKGSWGIRAAVIINCITFRKNNLDLSKKYKTFITRRSAILARHNRGWKLLLPIAFFTINILTIFTLFTLKTVLKLVEQPNFKTVSPKRILFILKLVLKRKAIAF